MNAQKNERQSSALTKYWRTRMLLKPVPLLTLIFVLELLLDKPLPVSASQADVQTVGLQEEKSIDSSKISAWIDRSILARPLFVSGRRLPHAIAAQDFVDHAFRLSGIIVAPNLRCAIFSISGSSKPLVVTEGGIVGDMSVVKIERLKVQLANGTILATSLSPYAAHQRTGATQPETVTSPSPIDTDLKARALRSSNNQFSHVR